MTGFSLLHGLQARQTDREEIRRKLAMGTDEDYYGGERAFKKPSLSTRLQGGMNLQICFMNDAAVTADQTEVTAAITNTSSAVTSSSQSHYNLSLTATTSLSSSSSYTTSSKIQPQNSQVRERGGGDGQTE